MAKDWVTPICNKCQTPLHGHRIRSGHVVQHHQWTSAQQFYKLKICHIPTSWHVEMLGSGIAMWQIYCTKSCRIVVSLSVGGVRVVEFGTMRRQIWQFCCLSDRGIGDLMLPFHTQDTTLWLHVEWLGRDLSLSVFRTVHVSDQITWSKSRPDFSTAGPTVSNSLPDELIDPRVVLTVLDTVVWTAH